MKLTSLSFSEGEAIPERHALSRNNGPRALLPAENINPHLAWDEVPAGTASFALLCADLDAPIDQAAYNTPSSELHDGVPRDMLYHWVLVDLAPSLREIEKARSSARMSATRSIRPWPWPAALDITTLPSIQIPGPVQGKRMAVPRRPGTMPVLIATDLRSTL